jgi:hypothetical protein
VNPKVYLLATAIAQAEGFYVPDSLPARCHNPGDLELGSVGCGMEQGKTIFPTDQAGWMALEHQCDLMLTGHSHVYKLTDRIIDVAGKYTGGDNPTAWASIVAHKLGVSAAATLQQYIDANF